MAYKRISPQPIAEGGTGATTLLANAVLVGAGTSAVTALAVGATGSLLVGTAASNPAFATSAVGDFSFTSSTAGATRALTVSNTDNTNAASNARQQVTTGGASAGDPFTTYTVTGATSFSAGIDNSASDAYKISASTALGTTDTFIMTTAGARTMPLHPAFFAYANATLANVTGDGTNYLVIFDSTRFNQSSSYNTGTGVFTAPVAGRYLFNAYVNVDGLLVGHTAAYLRLFTSQNSDNYYLEQLNPYVIRVGNGLQFGGSLVCDMGAGSTASVRLQIGSSTKDVSILGRSTSGNEQTTYFSGALVC